MSDAVIELKGVSRSFPGVKALDNISFNIERNTVHCIVGENGAGKSTLIKILAGVQSASEGQIFFNGKPYAPKSTRDAMKMGVSVLFQELNVVDQLSVEENLTLGMEKHVAGFIKKAGKLDKIEEILGSMDSSIRLNQRVSELSVAQKQVIEITKAVATDADIIIMDEPTAAITESEIKRLFSVIKNLRKQNVTVIYISHRLTEIFEIGDYVTVLRDGQMIDTRAITAFSGCSDDIDSATGQVNRHVDGEEACRDLIRMMLGKVVMEGYTPNAADYGSVVLSLDKVCNEKLRNVTFDVYKGETLGVYGLVGSGKSEIARAIYGVDKIHSGEIKLEGEVVSFAGPRSAIDKQISCIPEERRTEGLCTMLNIRENTTLMNIRSVSSLGILDKKKERALTKDYIRKLQVACRNEDQKVALLSGGNQQKIVLAKCLNSKPKVFLMDEPTRGVDVGAKEEIHNIIRDLAKEGVSSIVFSSELPEVMNLCDRVILLYEGEIKQIIKNGQNHDYEEILHVVTGGTKA